MHAIIIIPMHVTSLEIRWSKTSWRSYATRANIFVNILRSSRTPTHGNFQIRSLRNVCITFRHFPLYISPYYYLPARHRDSEGLIFCRCGFSFSFFFFFRRLISKVTERILTKLGHIFTYDCYLKKMVRTLPGIYFHGLGAKTAFGDWDRLWTLTKKHISATEHDINNRKQSPTCPQIRWTLVQK